VEVFDDTICELGEGPVWDLITRRLWWIDIEGKKVYAKGIQKNDKLLDISLEHKPGALALWTDVPLTLVLATAAGFQKLDVATEEVKTLVARESLEDQPENRFNDAKVDALGRFWAGSMHQVYPTPNHGSLYSLQVDETVKTHLRPLSVPNGIDWSGDNKTMYFIDSVDHTIDAFDFDLQRASLSNRRTVIRMEEGAHPRAIFDGMTVDAEGMIWVAIFHGSCVRRYDPKSAVLLQQIDIPALYVTSLCFGGAELELIFVTTAGLDSKASNPQAGKTFVIKNVGVRGVRMNTYK
jgi:sugar lactone lactonase YvrE